MVLPFERINQCIFKQKNIMVGEILMFLSFFLMIFGVFYLFFSTRNKERLALIEKGVDASVFIPDKTQKSISFFKIVVLNFSLLLMAIGLGIFIASILHYNLGVDEDVAYPGTIFLMAGAGLFAGFYLTKRLEEESNY